MVTNPILQAVCRMPIRPARAPDSDDQPAFTRLVMTNLTVKRPASTSRAATGLAVSGGGHRELRGDLRLADEGAANVTADQHAVAGEVAERRPNGETRDTVVGTELALGRLRVTHAEMLDQ